MLNNISDKKCQDYVYIKWEYLKNYVENKALFETWNKANENNVLSYCDAFRCETIKNSKKVVLLLCQTYKTTTILN